jgi:hypothetical protein
VNGLVHGGSAFWIFPVSLLVFGATFGLLPGLVLRLLVRLYPKDDPRRHELFAELYGPKMTRFRRFEWVFQQLETALRDGLSARHELRRRRARLAAARQRLVEYTNRARGVNPVALSMSCHRTGQVRTITSPEDLTTNDMVSGTVIIVRWWSYRQSDVPEPGFREFGHPQPTWPAPPTVELPAILDWSIPLPETGYSHRGYGHVHGPVPTRSASMGDEEGTMP